jgi:CubicO group peptidase (beta-lactamase class C family)
VLSPSQQATLEALVGAARERLGIPGLTVALARAAAPEIAFARGFGWADLENEVPARELTSYRLASLSKPITAVAVMQLAEQGRLDLDAPIQRYVPAWPAKAWPVSARQLLAHQGGVRHVAEHEWGLTRHFRGVSEALEVFKDDALLYEPGTRVLYSTYGYCLLGAAVEGASTATYMDYLRAAIFKPAGLLDTRDDDVQALIALRAQGYRREGGLLMNSSLADTSNKIPAGGLIGTAPDLARFGAALLGGRLLQANAWRAMSTPQRLRNGRATDFGLGFRLSRHAGEQEVWHQGGQPRVSTLLYLLPRRGWSLAVLSNLEGLGMPLLELAREIGAGLERLEALS